MFYQDMEMPDIPFWAISVKFQIQPVMVLFWSCSNEKNYFKLDITSKIFIESDATIVHLLFRLFIRSIDIMKRVIWLRKAYQWNFKPFSGKVSRWMIQTSFDLEMQKTSWSKQLKCTDDTIT
jgi:hypothetical protein